MPPMPHDPEPSQVDCVVSFEPMHDAPPHAVVFAGNTHAPVVSQEVAPQGAVVGLHAAVQQVPVPETPHTSLWH
jgi:hypothetical protein